MHEKCTKNAPKMQKMEKMHKNSSKFADQNMITKDYNIWYF